MTEIFLDAPNLGKREASYVQQTIDSGFVSTFGPKVGEFEEKITSYTGAEAAAATQSGTAALHLSLFELGIGPGDEVLVPATTFAATGNMIRLVGATPIIVDIDSETWNMSLSDLESKISDKTKAVLPVHLFGNPCSMKKILALAKPRAIAIVEDAAQALGARSAGKHCGTFGEFGCLSFNGNKIITSGSGGMVLCDKKKVGHIRSLADHGRDTNLKTHTKVGLNYRMSNLSASLGLAQFERLEELLEKKQALNLQYRSELEGEQSIRFQAVAANDTSSYWFTCVQFPTAEMRAKVEQTLGEHQIPSRRVFQPLPSLPAFQCPDETCPEAYRLFETALCLPSSTLNTREQISFICSTIKGALKG